MLTAEALQEHLRALSIHSVETGSKVQKTGNSTTLSQDRNFRSGEMISIHVHPALCTSPLQPGEFPEAHRHDFIEIAFLWEGTCGMEVERQPLDLNQGDFVILDNNSTHRIFPKDDTLLVNLDIRTAFFDDAFFRQFDKGDALAGFFANTIYSEKAVNRYMLFRTGNDSKIRQLFTMIMQEYFAQEIYCNRIMEDLLCILLVTMVRLQKQSIAQVTYEDPSSDGLVSEIIRYMNDHLERLNRDMLATQFGYSYSYIATVLQTATGLSFSQMRKALRLQRAELLLRTTDRPISIVAQDSGFSNMSSFYELFKESYGSTPQDYRKRTKQT